MPKTPDEFGAAPSRESLPTSRHSRSRRLQSTFGIAACLVFGFIGYFMLRYGYAVVAATLGVLHPWKQLESSLRQGLLIADGSV